MAVQRVLFVCMGNICRSPAGEAIFREMAQAAGLGDLIQVESCGMGDWYLGASPDSRMAAAARARGWNLQGRARLFEPSFFDHYDYILAVNREIFDLLQARAALPQHKAKVHLLADFSAAYPGQDIPDPFFGGQESFELVLDMLEDCCGGLLEKMKSEV